MVENNIMPTDDLQKALLSFSMEQFVSFISLLPLLSFASCVAVALAWHYEETTSTHCHVSKSI